MLKLDWSDLLIQGATQAEFASWAEPWGDVLWGQFAPLFLNRFGCWFILRPEGYVEMFDVLSGETERVAESHDAFVKEVNDRAWQETYLLSKLIYSFHEQEKIAKGHDCYAIAPHPGFGGPNPYLGQALKPENVMVMGVRMWQSICRQSLAV